MRFYHQKNGWRWNQETLKKRMKSGEIYFNNKNTNIKRRTYLADSKGVPPSSYWDDLDDTGHNRQAKYEQKQLFPEWTKSQWFSTPKPEKLLKKVLEITTNKNDLVLDSFLGSGTTAAVAHKMGRKYIGVELGDHAFTHCVPRMKKVIEGEQGGISKAVNWQGGGGFKFYTLAPSLLQKDNYGNWVIDQCYNGDMLAAAMAKQEGFLYKPDGSKYWKQGQSTEQDYIYTTTQFVTVKTLDKIKEEMQEDDNLLICCKAFSAACKRRFDNITIKKIPQILLGRCEFGKEDYSLNIIDMPFDREAEKEEEFTEETTIQEINRVERKSNSQKTLFD